MPKFKMEQSFSLNSALAKLGMADMFDANKANFSEFSAGEPLYVSEVVHKAFLEVSTLGVVWWVSFAPLSPFAHWRKISRVALLSSILMIRSS